MIDAHIQNSWPLPLWLSTIGMTGRGIRIDVQQTRGSGFPKIGQGCLRTAINSNG